MGNMQKHACMLSEVTKSISVKDYIGKNVIRRDITTFEIQHDQILKSDMLTELKTYLLYKS